MMRIQRLAHLFLRGGGSIFSVIGVTGGTSGGLRNLSITSLSSFLGYTANGKRNLDQVTLLPSVRLEPIRKFGTCGSLAAQSAALSKVGIDPQEFLM